MFYLGRAIVFVKVHTHNSRRSSRCKGELENAMRIRAISSIANATFGIPTWHARSRPSLRLQMIPPLCPRELLTAPTAIHGPYDDAELLLSSSVQQALFYLYVDLLTVTTLSGTLFDNGIQPIITRASSFGLVCSLATPSFLLSWINVSEAGPT